MEMPVKSAFWGKLETRDDVIVGWHPLVHHCADVAACTEALLTQLLLRKRLARLAGMEDVDEVTAARLCVFAALHDLGKFNQHFQNKGRSGAHPRAGHVRELVPLFGSVNEQDAFFAALGSAARDLYFGDALRTPYAAAPPRSRGWTRRLPRRRRRAPRYREGP